MENYKKLSDDSEIQRPKKNRHICLQIIFYLLAILNFLTTCGALILCLGYELYVTYAIGVDADDYLLLFSMYCTLLLAILSITWIVTTGFLIASFAKKRKVMCNVMLHKIAMWIIISRAVLICGICCMTFLVYFPLLFIYIEIALNVIYLMVYKLRFRNKAEFRESKEVKGEKQEKGCTDQY